MLKLKNFTYEVDNSKTNEKKTFYNYTNPVMEDDHVFSCINITLLYEYVTFNYTSSSLLSMKRNDWIDLIYKSGFSH